MSRFDGQLMEQMTKRISIGNPWWITGSIAEYFKKLPERVYLDEFYHLVSDFSVRRAIILMGSRRVGKTVMIYHVIRRLIEADINPRKIIYISVDNPIYYNHSLEELFCLAKAALKQEDNHDGYYVFFDEIQYLKDWEVHLKSLVDTYRSTKFVASGSAAAALKMKSTDSGAGRFSDFMLPPLTFYEYINLQKLNSIFIDGSSIVPYDTINIDELNRHFIDYINYGGFPEVVFSEKLSLNIKKDIIDKVLLCDLPNLYGITDIQELNKLFVHIAFRSGNEFSYEKLSVESGIKKEVLKKYLEYLEATFLIKVSTRVDQNARHMQRVTSFKIYLTNPSLRCALFSPVNSEDGFLESMVETAVISQWIQEGKGDIYYSSWIDGREKGEVDIVWMEQTTQKPLSLAEIRWTDRFAENPMELKSLQRFLEKNLDVQKIIVTTKTLHAQQQLPFGNVLFIPSAIYAYWVSACLFKDRKKELLYVNETCPECGVVHDRDVNAARNLM